MLHGDEFTRALSRGRQGHQSGFRLAQYAPFFEYRYHHPQQHLETSVLDYINQHPEDASMKGGDIELRTVMTNLERLEAVMAPREK